MQSNVLHPPNGVDANLNVFVDGDWMRIVGSRSNVRTCNFH